MNDEELNKLASEAWQRIQEDVDDHLIDSEIGIAIIQSAIEEATEPYKSVLGAIAIGDAELLSQPWTVIREERWTKLLDGTGRCLADSHMLFQHAFEVIKDAHNASIGAPTEWFCNKCGYAGKTQLHKGCDYNAAPIAPTGDTKRLDYWLKLCGDGEHAHIVFFDREAIDAAMKDQK